MKNQNLMPRFQVALAPISEINRVQKELETIPNLCDLEDCENFYNHTVHAHYFYAGCDWFVLAVDKENESLFAYAILNQDYDMSELGYVSIAEITNTKKIELDFYWSKTTLEKALVEVSERFYRPRIQNYREFLKANK